jgi:putative ABC transport system permease protein
MILLRLISWQYARKHKLRWILTAAGIVLGVGVFVGMHTANQSVLAAFYKTVDRIAGATQLQISAGESGFPEDVLERVQAVPGVRVAVPVIEATVNAGLKSKGNILILGVDMTGDRSLRDYEFDPENESAIEDPLIFLAQADSIMVTKEFAAQNGLALNSRVPMRTMDGDKRFVVRGIMKSGGLAGAFGGNLAVMDIYAAQKAFGRGPRFDRIDLAVNDGVRVEDAQAKLQAMLGPGFQVETPSGRGQQFESLSSVYAMVANITSLFALFIGMFIIYNTFSIAVAQRHSEIGILRALGATQKQIRALFLLESGVTGLAGSIVGVGLGMLIARGVSQSLGQMFGEMYGVAQRAEELSADPRLLFAALALGVVTSLVAGVIPARQAARVDPVQALQKGRYQVLSAGESRARRIAAMVLVVLALACLIFNQNRILFYCGYFMAIGAAILMAPALAYWLSRMLRPAMRWIRPVEGTLAADSLIQAPRRTSGVVTAVMLSLALVISISGMAQASIESIGSWLRTALNPDFFIGASETFTNRSMRFPAAIGERVRRIEGVRKVQMVRTPRIIFGGGPVLLIALEVGTIDANGRAKTIAGDPDEMYKLAGEGKGVILADNLAQIQNIHYGDTIEIATPKGVLRTPVVGVIMDFSDQKGSIFMDRNLFIKYWDDDTVNTFRVYVQPGASEREVRRRIEREIGSVQRLFIFTNSEVKKFVLDITDQWFGMTYVQIAVAALVAILGIINTLTVSITDRRRELGVLQAVGGLRRQVRHTVWLEAVAIGFIALVLGLALGGVSLYYSLEMSSHDMGGIRLDYQYPWKVALALFPAMLITAWLSSLGPAEAAVRGSLTEALEYE